MAGSEQNTMDGESKIEGAIGVGPLHDAQRLRPRYGSSGASDATETLRSSLIAATVEVLAEGVSHPRLGETGVTRIAP